MNIPEGYGPFNYEEALKRPQDVFTRDGQAATIAGYNPDAIADSQIIGWVDGCVKTWDSSGLYLAYPGSTNDLFLRAKTVIKYRNDYGPSNAVQYAYGSIERAKEPGEGYAKAIVAYTYQADRLIKVEIVHKYE